MNTHIKQVQIIVSLLKQNDIRYFVISPGTRHVPLVHLVETDNFFTCYSVVDERSAGYVALGLAEATNSPVCLTCTSATATCNYLPAIKEAYERNLQIVALTADRARFQRFHGENQCINQVDMYNPYTLCSVDVPNVQNEEEYWYCNRCVNEALLELDHHGKGPVQINFLEPLSILSLSHFSEGEVPKTRKIDRLNPNSDFSLVYEKLRNCKRILVISGQYYDKIGALNEALLHFYKNYESVITYDHFSSVCGSEFIFSPVVSDVINDNEMRKLAPDLIITFGTKVFSGLGVKYRNHHIEHWHITPEGEIYDSLHTLRYVFEMEPETFFRKVSSMSNAKNSKEYRNAWNNRVQKLQMAVDDFTNRFVVKRVLENLPDNSMVHTSVLNSMRLANFCHLPHNTILHGNICADGIDGALSSFLGQAAASNKLSLLIVGDLSFLYDMNVLLDSVGQNLRVLLINNYSGAEFHYNISVNRIDILDRHIAANHRSGFQEIAKICNWEYLRALNETELSKQLSVFWGDSDRPIILEVVTDRFVDGKSLRDFYNRNRKTTLRKRVGDFLRKVHVKKEY